MPEDSIANDLALLSTSIQLSPQQRQELFGLIAKVKRLEMTLDYIAQGARQSASLVAAASNVVKVDFARR